MSWSRSPLVGGVPWTCLCQEQEQDYKEVGSFEFSLLARPLASCMGLLILGLEVLACVWVVATNVVLCAII